MPSSSLHNDMRIFYSSRSLDQNCTSIVQAREEPLPFANVGKMMEQGPGTALMTSKEIENVWEEDVEWEEEPTAKEEPKAKAEPEAEEEPKVEK